MSEETEAQVTGDPEAEAGEGDGAADGDGTAVEAEADDAEVGVGEEPADTDEEQPRDDEGSDEEKQDEEDELQKVREEIQVLRAKNQKLESERDDLESRLKRVQADFENYKRRAEEKIERARQRGVEDVVEDLVSVKDDVERALEAGEDADPLESLEMLDGQLDDVLRGYGVERVEPTGELDPEKHEAVMRVDSSEHGEGEVVEVHEPGYVVDGRVVRTAKVSVASGDDEADEESQDRA